MADAQQFEISLQQAVFPRVAVDGVEHGVETDLLAVHRHGEIVLVHRIAFLQIVDIEPSLARDVDGIQVVLFPVEMAIYHPARLKGDKALGRISPHDDGYASFSPFIFLL